MAARDNGRESVSLFFSALPLFLMWLTLPLVLLVLSSWYQSERLLGERTDRTRAEKMYRFPGSNSENLVLHVSTPYRLRVDPDAPYDDSLVVWLTGSLGAPSTAYVFFVDTRSDSVDFVDENGISIPNTVSLVPTQDNKDAKTLYLRANPAFVRGNEDLVLFVGAFPSAATPHILEIPVERLWRSRLRHFLDALFGFPTLIGGLLTAIVGFGFQQWKVQSDETLRKKQRDEDDAYQRIATTFKDKDVNYRFAFAHYMNSLRSGEGFSQRLKRLLEDCSREALKRELDDLDFSDARLLFSLMDDAKLDTQKIFAEALTSCKQTRLTLLGSDPEQAKKYIDELANSSISIEELPNFGGVALAKLGQLLKCFPEIAMNSDDSAQTESADIRNGMAYLRISVNPFGSKKVERDQQFDGRFDRILWKRDVFTKSIFETIAPIYPISFEHMEHQSQLILGQNGSGKTAVALLMAGLSLLLSEKKMFPVYCRISSRDNVDSLLRRVTSVLMNYFVKNCQEFLEMPPAKQSAIAALLANYVAVGPELSFRLYLAGLSKESVSADFHSRLKELTDLAALVKLNSCECAHLLLQICPPEYKKVLFLFDYQDNGKQISKGNKEIVHFLQDLIGAGSIIKVFSAPSDLANAISRQLCLSTQEITWDDEKIKKVLQTRMETSNIAGVGIFFDPFDPSLRKASRELLTQASEGAPGHLIHLGNEILAYIGRNGRVLARKDAEDIFGALLVQKVIQESSTA